MSTLPETFGVPDHSLRLVIGRTRIDFDKSKEEINRLKHGYSLESAAYLLQRRLLPISQPRFLFRGPFEVRGEFRYEILTLDDDDKTVVLFVVTMRPDEIVRLISFRKASEEETLAYHKSQRGMVP